MLLIGSQRLTYEIDQKHKYTSRRTDDLAPLTEARRLKSIAIYLPESSKPYMRRRHEPPHIVAHMANKTELQPNFRKFRALRTLQGVDYFYCLRGVQQITFWDYDKHRTTGQKVPVRDWTFVHDINESVRREKVHEDAHFSELRYLAPILDDLRPSTNLAGILEAVVNPPPPPTGLLSPPPESEILYPHPQSPVDLSSDVEDQSEEDSDSTADYDAGDSDPDDAPDQDFDNGGGGGDHGAVGGDHDNRSRPANSHSPEPHVNENEQEEQDVLQFLGESRNDLEEHKYEPSPSSEVWSDNGASYDLLSDNEDEDGASGAVDVENEDDEYGAVDADQAAMPPPPVPIQDRASEDAQGQQRGERERSDSLFVKSPEREQQAEFVAKVETPSPPRPPPPPQSPARSVADRLRSSSRAVHEEVTPVRQTREESDLFVSPTPYGNIVPQPQAGDRASPIDLTEDPNLATSARPSPSNSPGQGQGQNKRPWSASTSDSGKENDAGDEGDCVFLGKSPKRPRR
jgi:hypothetical protein